MRKWFQLYVVLDPKEEKEENEEEGTEKFQNFIQQSK